MTMMHFFKVQRWIRFVFFVSLQINCVCCNLSNIFGIWVKDIICNLNFLWCLLHSLLGGCLCSFLHGRKLKNKEKKASYVLYKRGSRKKLLSTPFLSFSLLSLCLSLSQQQFQAWTILTLSFFKKSSNNEMWRCVMLLIRCCHGHCFFI